MAKNEAAGEAGTVQAADPASYECPPSNVELVRKVESLSRRIAALEKDSNTGAELRRAIDGLKNDMVHRFETLEAQR